MIPVKNRRCKLCGLLQPEKQLVNYRRTVMYGPSDYRTTTRRSLHCRDFAACRARRTCIGCGDVRQNNSLTWDDYVGLPLKKRGSFLDRPLCEDCKEVLGHSPELAQACSVALDGLLERDAFKEQREAREKRVTALVGLNKSIERHNATPR